MTLPVRTRLKSALRDGSKSDRLVASYMKDALVELPFETAASIAKKVKVREATSRDRICRPACHILTAIRDFRREMDMLATFAP